VSSAGRASAVRIPPTRYSCGRFGALERLRSGPRPRQCFRRAEGLGWRLVALPVVVPVPVVALSRSRSSPSRRPPESVAVMAADRDREDPVAVRGSGAGTAGSCGQETGPEEPIWVTHTYGGELGGAHPRPATGDQARLRWHPPALGTQRRPWAVVRPATSSADRDRVPPGRSGPRSNAARLVRCRSP
jgi:hypothetical protein